MLHLVLQILYIKSPEGMMELVSSIIIQSNSQEGWKVLVNVTEELQ